EVNYDPPAVSQRGREETKMRVMGRSSWCVVVLLSFHGVAAAAPVPLIDAIKRADRAAIRTLVKQQVDVNLAEADGMTALHWAARLDDVETADLLIRAGANVKAASRYSVTPLSLAAANGNAVMLEKLLEAGADANTAQPEGETALMLAAGTGNVAAIKVLLGHGADVTALDSSKGQSALMWAAAEGHAAAVRLLIETGADVHARSKGRFTPLLFAVRRGAIDVARVLLAAGAAPNETVQGAAFSTGVAGPTEDSTSVLGLAIINGQFDVARLLLENGANTNAPDSRGSLLHALAWMRRPGSGTGPAPPQLVGDSLDLARVLLARGANPDSRIAWKEIPFDRDDGEAKSPPNISVGRDFLSMVGATPFFLAAKNGDVALMRVLAENGADARIPTVQNVRPFMAAAGLGYWDGETPGPFNGTPESERLEAVRLALDLSGEDVNAVADFGDFPIEGDGQKLLYAYPDNLERLPEQAIADVRWAGSTALHGAAIMDQLPIIQFLVDRGARLDVRNKLGWSPLMVTQGMLIAANGRWKPRAEALIRKLMIERDLDPALFSQRPLSTTIAVPSRQ
ncbi:MAG: ankyrin repeat domain-containing protein, partial [Vicinamibacterales bacterium]